ncbi:unnamed protein product [Heligmosomoides polygyrus]|uniref:RRM domain-containing protein n=1 Tax=Heligmosomoides polygyrus TaxID=6339 RepID=A0A3P7XZ29_HELPZ|nr:unnamed protein product [Heligmosomoides polygyrus]
MQQNRGFSVYVGNQPYQCTEEYIGNHFSDPIKSPRSEWSSIAKAAFGFCEFAYGAGAENAVTTFNVTDFSSSSLRVNHASRKDYIVMFKMLSNAPS